MSRLTRVLDGDSMVNVPSSEFFAYQFFDWRSYYRLGQNWNVAEQCDQAEGSETAVSTSKPVPDSRPDRTASSDVDSAFGGSDDVSPSCSRTSNKVAAVDRGCSGAEREASMNCNTDSCPGTTPIRRVITITESVSNTFEFCALQDSSVGISLPEKLTDSIRTSLVSAQVNIVAAAAQSQCTGSVDITLPHTSVFSTAASFAITNSSLVIDCPGKTQASSTTFTLPLKTEEMREEGELSDSDMSLDSSGMGGATGAIEAGSQWQIHGKPILPLIDSSYFVDLQGGQSEQKLPRIDAEAKIPPLIDLESGVEIMQSEAKVPRIEAATKTPPLIDLESGMEIIESKPKRARIEAARPIPYKLPKLLAYPDLSSVPTFPLYNPNNELTSELLKCGNFKFHKHAGQKVTQQEASSSTAPRFANRPRYQPFEVPDHMKRRENDRNAHRVSDVQLWSQAAIDERMARDKDTPGCIRYMNEQCSGTGNVSPDDLAALHVEHVQNADCFAPGLGRFASPDAAAKSKDAQTFFEHGSVRRKRGLMDECVELSAMKLYTTNSFDFANGYQVYPSSDTAYRKRV